MEPHTTQQPQGPVDDENESPIVPMYKESSNQSKQGTVSKSSGGTLNAKKFQALRRPSDRRPSEPDELPPPPADPYGSHHEGTFERAKVTVSIPFFDQFTPENAKKISKMFDRKNYSAGEVIAEEGTPYRLFVVVSGLVDISTKSRVNKDEDIFLKTYNKGEIFGEVRNCGLMMTARLFRFSFHFLCSAGICEG